MSKPKPKPKPRPHRTSKPKKPGKVKAKPKPTMAETRRALGFSQVELAELIGVHPITVSRWERGVLKPHPWHIAIMGALSEAGPMNYTDRYSRIWRRSKEKGPIPALYLMLMRFYDPDLYRERIDNDKN